LGAAELLRLLLTHFEAEVVPYTALLALPLMARLSDWVGAVRHSASLAFAAAVRLLPLEAGTPLPPLPIASASSSSSSSSALHVRRLQARADLQLLLQPSSTSASASSASVAAASAPSSSAQQAVEDELPLPSELSASLRPYQRAGVKWLAFLKRFNLHGCLCDDMVRSAFFGCQPSVLTCTCTFSALLRYVGRELAKHCKPSAFWRLP
jgi:TATA-binding protein-associated factor